MSKARGISGFTVSDLLTPLGLLVVLGCMTLWFYDKHCQKTEAARQAQAQELVREINANVASMAKADDASARAERPTEAARAAKPAPAAVNRAKQSVKEVAVAADEDVDRRIARAERMERRMAAFDASREERSGRRTAEDPAAAKTPDVKVSRRAIDKIYSRQNAQLTSALDNAQ